MASSFLRQSLVAFPLSSYNQIPFEFLLWVADIIVIFLHTNAKLGIELSENNICMGFHLLVTLEQYTAASKRGYKPTACNVRINAPNGRDLLCCRVRDIIEVSEVPMREGLEATLQ